MVFELTGLDCVLCGACVVKFEVKHLQRVSAYFPQFVGQVVSRTVL